MRDPISCTSFSLLHSQSYLEEEEASVFLQNTCTYLQNLYMAQHPPQVILTADCCNMVTSRNTCS